MAAPVSQDISGAVMMQSNEKYQPPTERLKLYKRCQALSFIHFSFSLGTKSDAANVFQPFIASIVSKISLRQPSCSEWPHI